MARRRNRGLRGCSALLGIAALCSPTAAQIVPDGTLGTPGALLGPDYVIPDSLGTQVGPNLFHSFSEFNINTGESALFTSSFAGATDNVISRVTGGVLSNIDGLLRSDIAGADFWLINPSGLVFGANATLDLQGSFHASTADELLLEDDGRFSASNISDTQLTVANPVAFGFMSPNPAPISISGASLEVRAREAIDLASGDLSIESASLTAPRGRIQLRSLAAPADLPVAVDEQPADPGWALGDVRIDASDLAASGGSGGDIYVLAGDFVMRDGSTFVAESTGSGANAAAGSIRVEAHSIRLRGGSKLTVRDLGSAGDGLVFLTATESIDIAGAAEAAGGGSGDGGGGSGDGGGGSGDGGGGSGDGGGGSGDGGGGSGDGGGGSGDGGGGGGSGGGGGGGSGGVGDTLAALASGVFSEIGEGATGNGADIVLQAPTVRLADRAALIARTSGPGSAGDISIVGAQQITVSDEAQIDATTNATGQGGGIRLEAPVIELLNGSRVGSRATAEGDGGGIVIVAPETLIVTGTNGNPDPARNRGVRITAASFFTATGDAGSIEIFTGDLELDDGARISSSTSGVGEGGSIRIIATGAVSLRGTRADGSGTAIKASTEVEEDEAGAVDEDRLGSAGTIYLEARSLSLADGAEIVSNTALPGDGGTITLDLDELQIAAARIASESTAVGADAGEAGAVNITADLVQLTDRGRISAATIDGTGGAITVDADTIVLTDLAEVLASTTGDGQGGDVVLRARHIELSENTFVSAASTGSGNAGALSIHATDSLELASAEIQTSAAASAGGNIIIEVGELVLLRDSTISAEASGVTPQDAGGNVSIDPDFVVLDGSSIVANANAGNGGNILIQAGFFVGSANSVIDASSSQGIDGEVLIDSPNEITGSVVPVEPPGVGADALTTQRCMPALAGQRSSLTVEPATADADIPGDFLSSPRPPTTALSETAAAAPRASEIALAAGDASLGFGGCR